jgi:hypothetical protein
MLNDSNRNKKYGRHKYGRDGGTSDCQHGCGCWMGDTSSGAKLLGIDPFGECPNNPKDKIKLGEMADHHLIVERRLCDLEERANKAEDLLRGVKPGTKRLAKQHRQAMEIIRDLEGKMAQIDKIASGS